MTFCRRALLCAIAAVLAVAAPTARAASDSAGARSALSASLPAGITLSKASVDQTAGAVREAVAKHTDMATEILSTAIMAKEPKRGQGKLPCADIVKLTRAAIASDNQDASKLVDTASSLAPECADALSNLLAGDNLGEDNPFSVSGVFGAGFGPGFPGSPGFVGSAPSGAFALPPISNPVTNSGNL